MSITFVRGREPKEAMGLGKSHIFNRVCKCIERVRIENFSPINYDSHLEDSLELEYQVLFPELLVVMEMEFDIVINDDEAEIFKTVDDIIEFLLKYKPSLI